MNREPYNFTILHPVMKPRALALASAMRTKPFALKDGGEAIAAPFEGFRHPLRQHHLLTATKSTKAGPWQSAHQYGLAIDFAGLQVIDGRIVPNSWTWDFRGDDVWVALKREAAVCGLNIPIAWDKGHVIHPVWFEVSKLLLT